MQIHGVPWWLERLKAHFAQVLLMSCCLLLVFFLSTSRHIINHSGVFFFFLYKTFSGWKITLRGWGRVALMHRVFVKMHLGSLSDHWLNGVGMHCSCEWVPVMKVKFRRVMGNKAHPVCFIRSSHTGDKQGSYSMTRGVCKDNMCILGLGSVWLGVIPLCLQHGQPCGSTHLCWWGWSHGRSTRFWL